MYPHAPLHPFGAHEGASRQLGCHGEFLQFAALRCHAQAATRGGLHVSVHTPHAAILSQAVLPGFSVSPSLFGLAGRGGRRQPPTTLGGARDCSHPIRPGSSGARRG